MLNGGAADKTFLMRRGRIAVEKDSKYSNGIAGVLGYYAPSQETASKNEAMSSEEIAEDQQQVVQQQQKQQVPPPQQKKQEEKKGFFQRLFNF